MKIQIQSIIIVLNAATAKKNLCPQMPASIIMNAGSVKQY